MSAIDASEWLISQTSTKNLNGSSISKLKRPQQLLLTRKTPITMSFLSGKGGVGKTTMAIKFAQILAQTGKRVLLLDFDYNLSNTRVKLKIKAGADDKFLKYMRGELQLNQIIYKTKSFDLISGCHASPEILDSQEAIELRIFDLLHEAERYYDAILIDCPAGIAREVLSVSAYCDSRIVVVNPEVASMTDAYGVIKILNQEHGVKQNHVLVNRVQNNKQYIKVVKGLGETAEKFLGARLHFLGKVEHFACDLDYFDEKFILEENNDQHIKLSHIVNKFVEEKDDSLLGGMVQPSPRDRMSATI